MGLVKLRWKAARMSPLATTTTLRMRMTALVSMRLGAGCLSPAACNYDPTAFYPGECVFAEDGYDCDGICIADACGGCTISAACNYNPEATFDDGSCDFLSCLSFGCTDPSACNYDEEATFDDGSCIDAQFPYDCDGECLNDDDNDGVCDAFEVFGCTDEDACNYVEGATNEDGSCTYDCVGCTSPAACNYDADATIDDGSCDFTHALSSDVRMRMRATLTPRRK